GQTLLGSALEQDAHAVEHRREPTLVHAAARLLALVALHQLVDTRVGACLPAEHADRDDCDHASHGGSVSRGNPLPPKIPRIGHLGPRTDDSATSWWCAPATVETRSRWAYVSLTWPSTTRLTRFCG